MPFPHQLPDDDGDSNKDGPYYSAESDRDSDQEDSDKANSNKCWQFDPAAFDPISIDDVDTRTNAPGYFIEDNDEQTFFIDPIGLTLDQANLLEHHLSDLELIQCHKQLTEFDTIFRSKPDSALARSKFWQTRTLFGTVLSNVTQRVSTVGTAAFQTVGPSDDHEEEDEEQWSLAQTKRPESTGDSESDDASTLQHSSNFATISASEEEKDLQPSWSPQTDEEKLTFGSDGDAESTLQQSENSTQ
jgi:hypothetical protein